MNIPFEDDYDGIGEFLEHYISLHSAGARLWWVLTAQHVQYKTMVMQAVVALQYECTHHLNYRALQLWSDVSQPATMLVLWFILKRSGRPLVQRIWLFSIPAFLYMSLCYYETINWAMTNLQNSVVVLFAVLCITLATSTRRGSFVACLLTLALAIGSSANGFLVEPVLLFLLVYARRLWDTVWSVAVTCAMVTLYAFNYSFKPISPRVPPRFAIESLIAFPFTFLGGAAGSVHLAQFFGLLLVVGFVVLTRKGWLSVCPASFGAALFSLLTACLVTLGRYRFGAASGITSHYLMYSVLLASLEFIGVTRLYLPPAVHQVSAWFAGLMLTGVTALAFWLAWDFVGYKHLRDRQTTLITHLILWERNPGDVVLVPNKLIEQSGREQFQRDLQRERDDGLYKPPYAATDPLPSELNSP